MQYLLQKQLGLLRERTEADDVDRHADVGPEALFEGHELPYLGRLVYDEHAEHQPAAHAVHLVAQVGPKLACDEFTVHHGACTIPNTEPGRTAQSGWRMNEPLRLRPTTRPAEAP